MKVNMTFEAGDLYRWTAAVVRELRYSQQEEASNSRRNAIRFKSMLTQFIASNAFPFDVPALSAKYLEWKTKHGYPTRIGMLKGELLSSITVQPYPNNAWFTGVNPNAVDSGGKNWNLEGPSKLVLEYALYLEEGTRGTYRRGPQPARPIFRRTNEHYAESGLWRTEALRSLARFKGAWR